MKFWKLSAAVAVVGFLSNCGGREVICSAGTLACNSSCVDTQNDKRHCGACGNNCVSTQVCNVGRCECPPGLGLVNGICTVLDFDGVAACFKSGELVPFNSKSLTVGNPTIVGTNPQSIGFLDSTMLVLDGISSRMFQATITSTGVITKQPWATVLGKGPNQVVVDGIWVYSVNSSDGTLQVLSRGGGDAGVVSVPDAGGTAGFPLGTTSQINFGPNSFPNTVAKSAEALWVPLLGGFGAEYDGGQAVVKVSLPDNNGIIKELARVDLSTLDMQSPAGKPTYPRPSGSAVRGKYVYVALLNQDGMYAVTGPGFLARIDTATNAVTTIPLGSSCRAPSWITPVGKYLAVSCWGDTKYDMVTYATIAVTGSGVALVDEQDKVASYYDATCPTCPLFNSGRSDAFGNRLVVGGANDPHALVLDVLDGKLVPVRGVDSALKICTPTTTGNNFVGDVRALH